MDIRSDLHTFGPFEKNLHQKLQHLLSASADEVANGIIKAMALPQAHIGMNNPHLKNMVYLLADEAVPPGIFHPDWFTGVSCCELKDDTEGVRRWSKLSSKERMDEMKKVCDAINVEMLDEDIRIGCSLEVDENGMDAAPWQAGLDKASSCIGIFVSHGCCVPTSLLFDQLGLNAAGCAEPIEKYWLVAKAGAGEAAHLFHYKMLNHLSNKLPLSQYLEEGEGLLNFRRIQRAPSRNRNRMLYTAASILGLTDSITIVTDLECPDSSKIAFPTIDANQNVIRRADPDKIIDAWIYTTGLDTVTSRGLCTMNNPTAGLVVFTESRGELTLDVLKNDSFGVIPFATEGLATENTLIKAITSTWHSTISMDNEKWPQSTHPCGEKLSQRLCWKKNGKGDTGLTKHIMMQTEPLPLWGSHASTAFLTPHALSKLGMQHLKPLELHPSAVCIHCTQRNRLETIAKEVIQRIKSTEQDRIKQQEQEDSERAATEERLIKTQQMEEQREKETQRAFKLAEEEKNRLQRNKDQLEKLEKQMERLLEEQAIIKATNDYAAYF